MADQNGSKDLRKRLSRLIRRVISDYRERTERAADRVSELLQPTPMRPKPAVARAPVVRRRRY